MLNEISPGRKKSLNVECNSAQREKAANAEILLGGSMKQPVSGGKDYDVGNNYGSRQQ